MIIDFQARMAEAAAAGPSYKVAVQSFRSAQISHEMLGQSLMIGNDALTTLPAQKTEIADDKIGFDRQRMEYFRNLLASVTERFARKDISVYHAPTPGTGRHIESDFLKPVFNSVMQRGHNYWEVLREIEAHPFPIPRDYIVTLPGEEARNPDREDIIKALVPFKHAQREALRAGWDEDTVAIRITHTPPSGLIMK